MSSRTICAFVSCVFRSSIVKSPSMLMSFTVNVCVAVLSKDIDVPFDTLFMNNSTCLSPSPVKAFFNLTEKDAIPSEIVSDVILLPVDKSLNISPFPEIP